MKYPTSHEKRLSVPIAGTEGSGTNILEAFAAKQPELLPIVEWLQKNRCNPARIIDAVLAKLSARGRRLPRDQRILYAKKVLLGEFFVRWAAKHHETTVANLQDDRDARDAEIRPFTFALMAIGNERAFKKVIPKLARQKIMARCGSDLGNAHDFSCFVIQHSGVLAHRFLSNFNPRVFNAASKAVKYLELTAVSHYLHSGSQVVQDTSGLAGHLERSTRMSARTKLAAKLAYLPSLLSQRERNLLRSRYGVAGSLVKRMKIKEIALLLHYPNAAVLSRKLYRVRRWIEDNNVKDMTEVPF